MNKIYKGSIVSVGAILCISIFLSSCKNKEKDRKPATVVMQDQGRTMSEGEERFRTKWHSKWSDQSPKNPTVELEYMPLNGLGFTEGVIRRDPSDVIKRGDTYYVWFTHSKGGPFKVGLEKANDTLRAYPWDLADIWYAISKDGKVWQEQGPAVLHGKKGDFDGRSIFTPNILVANGRYYLFYQMAPSISKDDDAGDFRGTKIGMSWAENPEGPWTKAKSPILQPGEYGNPGNYPNGPIIKKGDWDGLIVHDPSLIAKNGKYYLYYKSRYFRGSDERFSSGDLKDWVENKGGIPIGWGVAIADKPEGPYTKSKLNPILIGGHECIIWPYKDGICALMAQGPEKNSIQFSKDGINFHVIEYVKEAPIAAGIFRSDFSDSKTSKNPDDKLWGISHVVTGKEKWNYLRRFELNGKLSQ